MRMQESTKFATKFSLNPEPRTLTPKLQASAPPTSTVEINEGLTPFLSSHPWSIF
jgi:hypothetical protein